MKLQTYLYGELEYTIEDIIKFKNGLLGFSDFDDFLLISSWDEDLPFYTLQSVIDNELYFILIKADDFFSDYKLNLTSGDREALRYKEGDLVQVFNIVHFTEELKDSTVNLKGPIVINLSRNVGKQVVLDNDNYELQYPLFAKLNSKEK